MVLYLQKTFKNCSKIPEKLQFQQEKLITVVFYQCHTKYSSLVALKMPYSWNDWSLSLQQVKLDSSNIITLNPPCGEKSIVQSELHHYRCTASLCYSVCIYFVFAKLLSLYIVLQYFVIAVLLSWYVLSKS